MAEAELSDPQPRAEAPRAEKQEPPKPDNAEAGQAKKEETARRKRRPVVTVIGILIIAGLVAGGYYYYRSTVGVESTDDAFTDGRAIIIAPQVAGLVVSLDVTRQSIRPQGPAADPYRSAAISSSTARPPRARWTRRATAAAAVAARRRDRPQEFSRACCNRRRRSWRPPRRRSPRRKPDYQRQRSLPKEATTQQEIDAATARLHRPRPR